MIKVLFFLLATTTLLSSKVLIITQAYNRPEFISWQKRSLDRFLQDDFTYVVFNDAQEESMSEQIVRACEEIGVACYRIPQDRQERLIGFPACRHASGIEYSLAKIGFEFEGIVAIVDSDLFLIKPFSIESYLQGYDIAAPCLWGGYFGDREPRHEYIGYLHPIVTFINMQTIPAKHELNFWPTYIDGMWRDTGAFTHHYINSHPDVKIRMMRGQFNAYENELFVFNPHDLASMPKETTLYKTLQASPQPPYTLRYPYWGRTAVSALHIQHSPYLTDPLKELILSDCDALEFYLDFTFLHYAGGSLYNGTTQTHSYKALQVEKYLKTIGLF